MNEKFKKIVIYIIAILLVLYGCFSTINWARNHFQLSETRTDLELCRAELGQLREEFARATDQQRIIAERLEHCTEISERTSELLGSSISTVEGLRTTLGIIRKNEEDMANELLYLSGCLNTNYNCISDNNVQ